MMQRLDTIRTRTAYSHHSAVSPLMLLFVSLVLSMFAVSCGKKLGTAGSINTSSWLQARSLPVKMQQICTQMQADQNGPNLIGMLHTPGFCQTPGRVAQSFRTMREFIFSAVDSSGQPFVAGADNSAIDSTLALRMESSTYLDMNLISIAGAVLRSLKNGEKKTGQFSSFQVISQDVDAKALKGTIRASFSTRGSPDSSILIQNNLLIHFAKIDDSLAFSVETVGTQPKKTSLFESFKVAGAAVFHGDNVLLQLVFNMNVHSRGVDASMQREITKAISNILYEALDNNLRQNQSALGGL